MNATDVLTAFRDHLVAQSLVRRASVSGAQSATGAPPPCHIEPTDGAPPAPGERETTENDATLVVTLRHSITPGESNFDSYRRRVVIDVIYRSKGTGALKRAYDLDESIDRLIGSGRPDYGLGWQMGSGSPVWVLSSQRMAGIGPVSRDQGQGSWEQAKYVFEVRSGD